MLTQILFMNKIIPYGKQHITQDDIDAVSNALVSDYLTQGPLIAEFEKAFANYVGAKYAVAVANGTAALHLCALAINVRPGDRVITTPITFAASANCVKYCGGEVVFSDITSDSYLLDLDKLEKLLESHPKGTFKGIIPVDFAGLPVDLERLKSITNKYEMWIIQDSCHSPGGFFIDSLGNQQNCGNSKFANLAIFSFHPVKHIATGEGGMITTNSDELYNKLLTLRTHGITKDASKFLNTISQAVGEESNNVTEYPGWYMEMQSLGYNYRLTDIQSALGISQLKKAEIGLQRRKEIAKKYADAFADASYLYSHSGFQIGHAYHLYIIKVKENRLGLYQFLKQHGIYAQVHYIPCHLMPYYQGLGYKFGDFPIAEDYYRGCLSIPIFPSLTDEEQNKVIETIREFYSGN